MPYCKNGNNIHPKRIKLIIDSSLKDVSLIGSAVNKLSSDLSFSNIESYEIEASVVEAVNNIVLHAYGNKRGNEVEVTFTVYPDRLDISIYDNGKTMLKKDIPVLDFDTNDRRNLPEKGMGKFIINNFMDRVKYTKSHGKNILTLTKLLKNDKC